MFEISGLSKRFGETRALDAVSLTIPEGSLTAVVGASGAGKTTLLRTLNRLVQADAGEARWRGEDVLKLRGRPLRAWRRRCAMIFQQFQLAPRLDVLTNVLVGALHGRPLIPSLFKSFPEALRARAILELDALGMAQAAFQRAETLSGGQQQRVAIARALMQDPEVILADEPIASLDPANAELVMEALARIHRERGITVLVNLHALETVRRFCPRVVAMAAGQVVFDGATAQLDASALARIYAARPEASAPARELAA